MQLKIAQLFSFKRPYRLPAWAAQLEIAPPGARDAPANDEATIEKLRRMMEAGAEHEAAAAGRFPRKDEGRGERVKGVSFNRLRAILGRMGFGVEDAKTLKSGGLIFTCVENGSKFRFPCLLAGHQGDDTFWVLNPFSGSRKKFPPKTINRFNRDYMFLSFYAAEDANDKEFDGSLVVNFYASLMDASDTVVTHNLNWWLVALSNFAEKEL